MKLYPLDNPVRPYSWGSHTVLAELQGRESPTDGPEAELWIGAHPTAPSTISETESLADLIDRDPAAALGPYGTRLPFLLKVLAVAHPLSLQVHPDPEQARAGFAREEASGVPADDPTRSYHDDQPKPEMLCALTDFTALAGFADPADSADLLEGLGVERLSGVVAMLRAADLKGAVTTLLTWPPQDREALVAEVRKACEAEDSERARWTVLLAEEYPGDTGVITAMLLNLLRLAPGEALYVPGRTPHAYLQGTGVEIMVGSDNVLRGGLTPKHIDLDELLEVTDFSAGAPALVEPHDTGAGGQAYDTPAPQFRLTRYAPGDGDQPSLQAPSAILCVEGEVTVTRGDERVTLTPGTAVFVPFEGGPAHLSGHDLAYQAAPGAPISQG